MDKIHAGYESLALEIRKHGKVIVDGFPGAPFNEFREKIDGILRKKGFSVEWIETTSFSSVDIFIDGQRPCMPVWMTGEDLKDTLSLMCRSPLRPRPWFEPGPRGGKWILNNIPRLSKNVGK